MVLSLLSRHLRSVTRLISVTLGLHVNINDLPTGFLCTCDTGNMTKFGFGSPCCMLHPIKPAKKQERKKTFLKLSNKKRLKNDWHGNHLLKK